MLSRSSHEKTLPHRNLPLLLLLAAVFFNGALWAIVVPLWQNYDEIEHLGQVAFIVEHRSLPIWWSVGGSDTDLTRSARLTQTDTALQSNQIIDAVVSRHQLIHQDFTRPEETRRMLETAERSDPTTPRAEYQNPTRWYGPAYYLLAAMPYTMFQNASLTVQSYAMRLVSVGLMVTTVYFTYQIALIFFARQNGALIIAAIVGFIPRFSFTGSGINNDALLIAVSTMTVYWMLRAYRSPPQYWLASMGGILIGIGLLTKPQFIFLVPLVAYIGWRWLSRAEWRRQAILAGGLLITTVWVMAGWWLGITLDTGMATGAAGQYLQPISQLAVSTVTTTELIQATLMRGLHLFATFWYTFGCCHEFSMAPGFIALFLGISGISLTGLGYLVYQRIRKKISTPAYPGAGILVAAIVLFEGGLLALFIRDIVRTGQIGGYFADGRYLYPVIAPLVILGFIGLRTLLPRRFETHFHVMVVIVIMLLNLIALMVNVIPRYYL